MIAGWQPALREDLIHMAGAVGEGLVSTTFAEGSSRTNGTVAGLHGSRLSLPGFCPPSHAPP